MNGYTKIKDTTSTIVTVLPKSRSVGGFYGNRFAGQPWDEYGGVSFGAILSRTPSTRLGPWEKQKGTIGMVRRALSVRKTSSTVADMYWRMHDECDAEEEEEEERERKLVEKKKGGIVRACRRFFGIKSSKVPSSLVRKA